MRISPLTSYVYASSRTKLYFWTIKKFSNTKTKVECYNWNVSTEQDQCMLITLMSTLPSLLSSSEMLLFSLKIITIYYNSVFYLEAGWLEKRVNVVTRQLWGMTLLHSNRLKLFLQLTSTLTSTFDSELSEGIFGNFNFSFNFTSEPSERGSPYLTCKFVKVFINLNFMTRYWHEMTNVN